jgi:HlyD family secretion protein
MKHTALLAFVVLLAGCGVKHEPSSASASSAPPISVPVVEARITDSPAFYEATGTVRAITSSALSSRVMGYVREINVNPGDRVRAGQLLVVIDSRDLESALLQAKASEQEAQSGVAEADNGIAAAQAQLTLARVTFDRMNDLFSKKSISNQEFDEAQARFRTAEANYKMAVSRRAQLDSKIAQAKQAVSSAAIAHSYSEIRAPFAGIVIEKRAEAGQMATPGAPLLVVEQAGGYRVGAPVEESMLGSARLGQTVSVALDTTTQPLTARISEIVPSIDPTSRAFIVKATLPAHPTLRTGAFARLRIPRGSHSAILIPADAITRRGELENVFVADGQVARLRIVTVGDRRDAQSEILSGLHAGEKVIHPRPANLTDGARIEVRQ